LAAETPFARFARTCEDARGTSSRLAKVALVAAFLREVAPHERGPAARFLAGKVLDERDPRGLEVGWALLSRLAAPGRGQATLAAEPLTIAGVARAFEAVAEASGGASRRRKEQLLRGLLARASPAERPWLLTLLGGEMRTGISDGLVLEGIAAAIHASPEAVRRAHLLRGDLGEVCALALDGGAAALEQVGLRVFAPLRPMLAETADSPEAAFAALGPQAALEVKFDGARIAIHRRGGEVRVFSRRLTEVTASLPEAVALGRALRCDEAVVEGEAVAYDAQGKPLPFQDLMRRLTRIHGLAEEQARVPLEVHLFDCLHVDGATLLDAPYRERWAALERIAPPGSLAPRALAGSPAEARAFYDAALARGHEGLVAKALDSPYTPGKRGAQWLKVKAALRLDCCIIGAEWGGGRREGWLSNYHLAVRVAPGEEGLLREPPGAPPGGRATRLEGWAMVGKTFKGLTDAEFEAMTARLRDLAAREEGWGFVLRPEVVVEVDYNELQRSPHYESGFALRFARIAAVRPDKAPEEADTLGEVVRRYAQEGATKGRLAD
jgi:DNA ligase 1